jgi:IS30 family transposase
MIGERPAIVEQRSRLGDWEIDTVHGRGKPWILTVVDRKSGLVRIGKLPNASAKHTLRRTVHLLKRHEANTITSDNGTEFHIYKQIEAQLDIDFYFATPHHAWERGTNENTNGLIRQYLPKRCNMAKLSQVDCNLIAKKLNNRPRLRLGFKTPNEVFYHNGRLRHPIASCGKL